MYVNFCSLTLGKASTATMELFSRYKSNACNGRRKKELRERFPNRLSNTPARETRSPLRDRGKVTAAMGSPQLHHCHEKGLFCTYLGQCQPSRKCRGAKLCLKTAACSDSDHFQFLSKNWKWFGTVKTTTLHYTIHIQRYIKEGEIN